jgi:hypothetical protein
MVAQAQFSVTEARVTPGGSMTLALALFNLGTQTEQFTLVPSGLSAAWVQINPATVSLVSGANATINVTVRPPALSTTSAGPHPIAVRIIPQTEPDDILIAETTALVDAFHDRRIQVLQPVRRSRRRATFEFLVENHGNAHASCRLQLVDLTKRLDGRFEPPAVGVEPGANALVKLRVRAAERQWRRGSRTLPFLIEASQQGMPSTESQATLVQTPIIAESLGRKLVGTVALGAALTAGWIWLLKPLAERAAKDAVKSAPAQIVAAAPNNVEPANATVVSVQADPGVTTTTSPVVVTPVERFTKRFTALVGAGNVISDTAAEVPAGKILEITDIMLQNPNFDTGSARLTLNGETLIPWNLENSTGNEPTSFRTGLVELTAGEKLVFEVNCATVGNATAGTCTTALLVNGVFKPAN